MFGTTLNILATLLLAGAASAEPLAGAGVLELDRDQMRRLGIEFSAPQLSSTLTVASAPAEVVIPQVRQSVVSTPVNGLVSALQVAVGEMVEAGQPIAEILSAEYMDMQRRFLDAAAAEQLAVAQLERDEGLHADGIIADRRLHETRAAAQSASLARSQALQQLKIAGFDDAAIRMLEARRELSSVVVLHAPMSGAVTEQYASVGSSLQSLAPVVKLADLGELWLEARLPQEAAARIDHSMQVRAQLNNQLITGPIVTVGQVVDSVTQTVLVRAVVDNSHARLLAGQFLTIEVVADSGEQPVLALPNGAITREGGNSFVFVQRENGVEAMPVTLLAEGSDRVYIESSLSADVRIAVSGVSALKALWLADEE
jgi:RND family efflux transporter MFP subunit